MSLMFEYHLGSEPVLMIWWYMTDVGEYGRMPLDPMRSSYRRVIARSGRVPLCHDDEDY